MSSSQSTYEPRHVISNNVTLRHLAFRLKGACAASC